METPLDLIRENALQYTGVNMPEQFIEDCLKSLGDPLAPSNAVTEFALDFFDTPEQAYNFVTILRIVAEACL